MNTQLSRRQREIVTLLATGASNKEIARSLNVSIKTITNTLTMVFDKTNTRSRTELAVRWIQNDLDSLIGS
jgi:DNA-binding NarL/FixJ family response regulator